MLEDYYSILGVSRSATQVEIKSAFRRLAKELHPDRNHGDIYKEEALKRVNKAYNILSDIEKKMAYDKRLYLQTTYVARSYSSPTYSSSYSSPNPASYSPRRRAYSGPDLVYSKWTLMYGKIFVVLLIMFVTLFPVMLEYSFSLYYYNEGQQAEQAGKPELAIEKYKLAMRDMGARSTEAAISCAEISLAQQNYYDVVNFARLGLGYAVKRANKAKLHYLRGVGERNMYRPDDAEESLTAALSLNFNSDSVFTELAPIYAYNLKKYAKAVATYDSLIFDHPEIPDHYLHRGFCLQKLGRHALAISDFDVYLNNSGPNGSAYYLKGISQISLSQVDSACVNFHRAKDNGIAEASTFIYINCEPDTTKVTLRARRPESHSF